MIITRLLANIDGYLKNLTRVLGYFLLFSQKVVLRAKLVYLRVLIKHYCKGV